MTMKKLGTTEPRSIGVLSIKMFILESAENKKC